jgi:hypothetical protein
VPRYDGAGQSHDSGPSSPVAFVVFRGSIGRDLAVTHQGWSEATEILDHFLVRYPDRGLGTTRRCGMAVYLRFDFSGLLGMVNVPAQAVTVSETAVLFPPQS